MFSGLSAAPRSTRRWTALASLTLQVAAVALALFLPMLHPENLPTIFLDRRIFAPMSNQEVHVQTSARAGSPSGSPLQQVLVVSRDSFRPHPIGPDSGPEAPLSGSSGPPGSIPGPGPLVSIGPAPLPLPPAPSRPIRPSVVMGGNLIRRVDPQYPAIARQIHLEGTVVLNAMISRDGNIERVEVASGPGLLALAAKEAVRQWRYRPYLLNGEPVEVETQITVNFVLEH